MKSIATSMDYVRIYMKSKATSMEYVGMTMSMLKRWWTSLRNTSQIWSPFQQTVISSFKVASARSIAILNNWSSIKRCWLCLIVFYIVFAMLFHRIVYHHIELETVIRAINAQKTPVNAQCERDCRLTTNHRITSTCDNIHLYIYIYIFLYVYIYI